MTGLRHGAAGVALLLLGLLFVALAPAALTAKTVKSAKPARAAKKTPAAALLEELKYQVDMPPLADVARARIKLTSLEPGRYRAEISGEIQGLLGKLSGDRRDTFSTEMMVKDGKLLPVVYREESRRKGKYRLKEYRFDYGRGRLELWTPGKEGMMRRWQTELSGPIYDPLSAFYNCRLGLLGPLRPGETLRLKGIPYPHPEEIEIRLGPEENGGRTVMVSIVNRAFENEQGVVFVTFDERRVPQAAWTRVLIFGKIIGQLQPESKALAGALPGLPPRQGTPEKN